MFDVRATIIGYRERSKVRAACAEEQRATPALRYIGG